VKPILALAALILSATASSAAIVTGVLNIDGAGGGVKVNGTTIDFAPLGGPTGDFDIVDPSTGTFEPLEGTEGEILDLQVGVVPPGADVFIPDFLTFDAAPNLTFSLLRLEEGVFSDAGCGSGALGSTCTPDLGPFKSPFELFNTNSGVSITLSVLTLASDGSGDPATIYRGTFTTQITEELVAGAGRPTIPQVLAAAAQGGILASSWSANFAPVAVIPEPSTVVLGLAGFALLGIGRFARRSK
jgi:hypothetical protein